MSSDVAKEKEMLKADLYGILGVKKEASDKELKKAYRTRARDLHPDKNPSPDAAKLFHQLQEAYDFMMDPAKRAKFNMHMENNAKQEVRRQQMDSVLRKKREDLEKREKQAEDPAQTLARKMAARKEEIKRLRAEGERLLEEEQAKYRVAKRAHEDVARIKLSWDISLRQYSQKELQSLLGTPAVVLSTKKKGRAIAEFESAQMAISAEFAAKRLVAAPIKVDWLTQPPSNYQNKKSESTPIYTTAQNTQFEQYQEQVLRRCEALV